MPTPRLRTVVATVVAGLALLGCAGTPDASSSPGVARDFVATTIAGDEISGASIRGQVTIVDFWAVF